MPAPSAVEVQARLTEAEETLRAIRNGEVDALVVQDASPAAQVFTLSSADPRGGTIEAELVARDAARIPVRINSSTLDVDTPPPRSPD